MLECSDIEPRFKGSPLDAPWPVVPGYDLISKLGEGCLGAVFKARQHRPNRPVALRMIRAGGDAEGFRVDRFRREIEGVASLQHRNIVQVHEIREVAGLVYASLEYLEGGSLADRLAGAPRPAREAAEMLSALCSAIEAAHEAGVLHLDLKPAGILLAADGTPRLTDFRLDRCIDEEDDAPGTIGGSASPGYLSPEQARAEGDRIGPASDIYSLGAILYEMLTGRPPFRSSSDRETIRQVIEDEPVPPGRLQPRVPLDLEMIALKCLAKEPSRRYASAKALGEDLRRYLAGEPILARPIPSWERALKWARRRPGKATLSAVAAAILIVMVGTSIGYVQHLRELDRTQAERLRSLVFRGREKFSKGREQLEKDSVAAEALLAELGRELDEQPETTRNDGLVAELRGQLDRELARTRLEADRTREARRSEERAREFRERLKTFQALRDEALYHATSFQGLQQDGSGPSARACRNKARAALDLFTDAVADGSRTLKPIPAGATSEERSEVVVGSYEMLLILAEAESRDPAVRDLRARATRALRVLDSAPRLDPGLPDTRTYHNRRKRLLETLGDRAEAANEGRAEAEVRPGNALDHFLKGLEFYRSKGAVSTKIPDAIREFEAALARDRDLFWARALMAISYIQMGRPGEARIILDGCLRDHANYAWLHILRGYASGKIGEVGAASKGRLGGLAAANEFDDAEVDFERAKTLLGDGDSDLWYALYLDRGNVRLSARRLDLAAEDFEAAIRADDRRHDPRYALAAVRLLQERFDAAIVQLTLALDLKPEVADAAKLQSFRALVRQSKADRLDTWAEKADRFAIRAARGSAWIGAVQSVAPGTRLIGLGSAWGASACRAMAARERLAALDDYSEIRRDPSDSPEQVVPDCLARARLLRKLARPAEAMKAAEEALAADPGSVEANRILSGSLLDQRRFDEAIAACDAAIASGANSADLFSIRGKAHAGHPSKMNLEKAIRDFDRSLELRPDQPSILIARGWARLMYGAPHGAPRLALDDFDRAVQLDPKSAEAFAGRGNAWASLERDELAVADAVASLGLDSRSPLNLYRCARIYALAADLASVKARQTKVAPLSPLQCSARAVDLLRSALLARPPAERLAYYRGAILPDAAFRSIRRDPRLLRVVFEALPTPVTAVDRRR